MSLGKLLTKKEPNKKSVALYCLASSFLIFELAVQVSPGVMALHIMQDLKINTLLLGFISGCYFYTYALMQIPVGLFFDRFKAKYIISCSIFISTIGIFLFGLVGNFYLLCFARLLMGLGAASAFISVLVVASNLFDKKYFIFFAGITQIVGAMGAIAGEVPISLAVNAVGWRETIFILAAIGLVLFIIISLLLNCKKNYLSVHREKISWMLSIKRDLLVIFKNKQTWYIALYVSFLWAPMSGFASLWGIPFLTHFDGLTNNNAAFSISMMWLGLAVGSPIVVVLVNLLRNKNITLFLSALIGVISLLLVLEVQLTFFTVNLILFITGISCSGQAITFVLVRENNPFSVSSTAIAVNNMAIVVSGAIFQPTIGKIIQIYQRKGVVLAYQKGCYVILFAQISALLIVYFLMQTKKESQLKALSETIA